MALKIGQKLWYINKFTGEEEYVIIRDLLADSFEVWYGQTGKHTTVPYSNIGIRLFLKPKVERDRLRKISEKLKITTQKRHAQNSKSKNRYAKAAFHKQTPQREYRTSHNVIPEQMAVHVVTCSDELQSEPMEKSCHRCISQKSGECTSLSGIVCDDFRAVPTISKAELDNFPQYGDATAIRRRDRRHFDD